MRLPKWRPLRRDGPFSWIVAVSAFLSLFLSLGLSLGTIGVLTVGIGERFGTASQKELSWIGAIRTCLMFSSGIVSSAFVNRFGGRVVQVAGSVIIAAATGVSTLATEVWHLYVTFGAIAGVGLSLVFTASSVSIAPHFDRYLHVALPLGQLGGTAGYCMFPAATSAMLASIGLDGTLYVLCGVALVPAFCALLYTGGTPPPSAAGSCSSDKHVDVGGAAGDEPAVGIAERRRSHGETASTGDARDSSEQPAAESRDADARGPEAPELQPTSPPAPPPLPKAESAPHEAAASEADAATAAATAADVGTYAPAPGDRAAPGQVRPGLTKVEAMSDTYDRASMVAVDAPATAAAAVASDDKHWHRVRRLLVVGDTWLALTNFFCRQYTASTVFVLLPTLAASAGRLSQDEAAASLTVFGAAIVAGHLTTIFVGARSYNRLLLFAVSCAIFGATTMAFSRGMTSVVALYPLCAFGGYWLGVMFGLIMSVIHHFSAPARLSDTFGLLTVASGLGSLAGPALTSFILLLAGRDASLYVCGAVSILAGLVLLPPAVRRRRGRQQSSDADDKAEPS